MTEGYTDEELLHCTWLDSNLFHAFQRLQHERDEARRVARLLAAYARTCSDAMSAQEWAAIPAALAYPEEKS